MYKLRKRSLEGFAPPRPTGVRRSAVGSYEAGMTTFGGHKVLLLLRRAYGAEREAHELAEFARYHPLD